MTESVRLPRFLAEMGHPINRGKLWQGVTSGYALAALFAVLAVVAPVLELVPFRWELFALVGLKLTTNTATWIALRTGRMPLAASALNVVSDVVCMTGAIYFTGGQLSPLFAIYAIEITVLALLSNLGVTVLAASLIMVSYGSMALLTHAGVIVAYPPPAASPEQVTLSYLVTDLAFAALVVGVPTFFTAKILTILYDKQRALEKKTEELVEAQREKAQFMANVTHELRTPIHGICGLSQLVESGVYGVVTEKQREAHVQIERSAMSLLGLIDDLLHIMRADAERAAFRPTEIHVTDVLEAVAASARHMSGTRDLTIDLDEQDDLPLVVSDRARLTQVILNLVTNAVKFTPDGGRIVLRARRDGADAIAIEVEDTGVGIAAEEIERVFEPFHQADGTIERGYGGVGLGLSVARRLIGLLGGSLSVESTPGVGTTFTVRVPVAHVAQSAA